MSSAGPSGSSLDLRNYGTDHNALALDDSFPSDAPDRRGYRRVVDPTRVSGSLAFYRPWPNSYPYLAIGIGPPLPCEKLEL